MRRSVAFLIACAIAAPAAAEQKPFVEPGTQPLPSDPHYPDEMRHGDHWADIQMKVDKKGQPTDCLVTKTDIRDKEKIFWLCHAMLRDWHIQPIVENGVAVAGTVTRHMVLRR